MHYIRSTVDIIVTQCHNMD